MHDTGTHLLLFHAQQVERSRHAAAQNRAIRVVRLRRLDRRVQQATARARLLRLAHS